MVGLIVLGVIVVVFFGTLIFLFNVRPRATKRTLLLFLLLLGFVSFLAGVFVWLVGWLFLLLFFFSVVLVFFQWSTSGCQYDALYFCCCRLFCFVFAGVGERR